MRGEDEPRVAGQLSGRRGHGVGKDLHEERMIEVRPQFHQLWGIRAGRFARAGDVLDVLGATGISTPRRRGENRCTSNAVVPHSRNGVLDERLPVAVAEIHREIHTARAEFDSYLVDQRPVDPVDRRHPAEVQVMLGYVVEALRRDVATAGDVFQKRPYLLRPFRASERK